jgi:hypothetical protein
MDRSVTLCCYICKELAGFYCNGCNRTFCSKHTDEHRQSLYEQLDWLTVDHDDLVRTLDNTSSVSQKDDQSRKIIDKWEEESIQHIQTTANEARRTLSITIQTHIDDVKKRLKLLTEKLNEANQKSDQFDERNIRQWATKLRNLKQDFITMSTFTVRVHGNKPVVMPIIKIQPDPTYEDISDKQPQQTSSGLIPIKRSISLHEPSHTPIDRKSTLSLQKDDRFDLSSDHVKILDNGQLITHNSNKSYASIRGFEEYTQGEHKLFFRIEHMTSDSWVFFGIISKDASLGQRAYTDSSAYGWAGHNGVYISGKCMPDLYGYLGDMKKNDYVELTLDCDKQTLFLWHSCQTYKDKLSVDLQTCPFPWKLLISFYNANDSVRLLPLSMSSTIHREQEKLNNDMKVKENGLRTKNGYCSFRRRMFSAGSVQ